MADGTGKTRQSGGGDVGRPARSGPGEVEIAIARGWALTPLKGKVPLLKNWTKQPRPTDDQMRQWAARGNVGLRTGAISGVFVIDVDGPQVCPVWPHDPGVEGCKCCKMCGPTCRGGDVSALELPDTTVVETGRGLRHYYFVAPTPCPKNSAGKLGPHIDTRGEGGQVVFPGSVHPDTGKPYRFVNLVDLAELPAPVLAKLTDRPQAVAGRTAAPTAFTSYAARALAEEVAAVAAAAEGTRNAQLNRSGFSLYQLVGGGQLAEAVVRSSLLSAAVGCGLAEAEAIATIDSAREAGMAQPRRPRGRPAVQREGQPPRREPGQAVAERPDLPEVLVPGPHEDDQGEYLQVGNHDFTREVLAVLDAGGLYHRAGKLGEVGGDPGKRSFVACTEHRARAIIDSKMSLVRWQLRRGKNAVPEKVFEPASRDHACLVMGSAGKDGLPRELMGIITAPTMRPDGSILDTPGYDEATRLLLEPGDTVFASIPESPARDDARAALLALAEPFLEFPFLSLDAGLSVCVAAILSLLARDAIDGCVPMFPIRSTTPGSGKGLVVDAICLVGTGREPARMAAPRGKEAENEWRKRIHAYAMEGDRAVMIDNASGSLGSEALAMALTARTMKERVLGVSQNAEAPLNAVWFATGNNLVFRGDLGRRVVPIDFDPKVEHPEDRQGPQPGRAWAHADLLAYVRARRPELVVAGLTMLRAFHVAGRPAHGGAAKGSFTEWDSLVRAAVIWAGGVDPIEAAAVLREEGDADLDVLKGALIAWNSAFSDEPKTTAEAVLFGKNHDQELLTALAALAGTEAAKLDGKRLGDAMRRVKGRATEGLRFVRAGVDRHAKVKRWTTEPTG